MIAFIVRRLLQSLLVMTAVAFIAFAIFNFVGDPVVNMMGTDATAEQRERMRQILGLNDPFWIQFLRFVGNVLQGNFGVSYRVGLPVAALLVERLPATLELCALAALLALAIGIPLGVYTGLHRHGALSRFLLIVSLVGVSLPTFLIGIILILVFAVWGVTLCLLPFAGTIHSLTGIALPCVDIRLPSFGRGTLAHLILPSITLSLFQMTLIMRLVRAEMLEVMRTDYIKFARARGLTNRAVNFGHALRNTLVPVITITGLQIGAIIAFAIVTETVFQWPGMGFLFIEAVRAIDIPVMSTYLVLIAFIFVTINLIVDLLYYAVDPRLRLERRAAGGH